jgi:hypothetical protein
LPVGKVEWAKRLVETARQCASRTLHVQAEAMVPNKQRGCIREPIGT